MSEFTMFAQPPVKPKPPVTEAPTTPAVPPVADFKETMPMGIDPAESAASVVENPKTSLRDATLSPARGDDVNIETALGKIGTWRKTTGDPVAGADEPVIDTKKIDPKILAGLAEFEARLKETGKFAAPVGEVDPVDPVTGKQMTEEEMAKAWEEAQKAFASAPVLTTAEKAKQLSVEDGKLLNKSASSSIDTAREKKADRLLENNSVESDEAKAEIKSLQDELEELVKTADIRKRTVDTTKAQYEQALPGTPDAQKFMNWYAQAMERLARGNKDVELAKQELAAKKAEFKKKFDFDFDEVVK